MPYIASIFWLASKEVRSFLHDTVLFIFVVYSFTLSIVSMANNTSQEVTNAAIAVADGDGSQLSQEIAHAFLPPYFKPAQPIARQDIDRAMDLARYTFVLDIPPHFQRDVLAGRQPALQVNVDATASMQAGVGAGYVQNIIRETTSRHVARTDAASTDPVSVAVHLAFNPNATPGWFMSIMAIINNITMLSMILSGAAMIREREHGTMDHLMTLPLTPTQIALSKVLANGFCISIAVALSLLVVVRGFLGIPIPGSIPLFMAGVGAYLFYAASVGLFLSTLARSMPQLGLLMMLVYVPMMLLSGGNTPIESEPAWMQGVMQFVASTHFVAYAQKILFRGAGFALVWLDLAWMLLLGAAFFVFAVYRFRRVAAMAAG